MLNQRRSRAQMMPGISLLGRITHYEKDVATSIICRIGRSTSLEETMSLGRPPMAAVYPRTSSEDERGFPLHRTLETEQSKNRIKIAIRKEVSDGSNASP